MALERLGSLDMRMGCGRRDLNPLRLGVRVGMREDLSGG